MATEKIGFEFTADGAKVVSELDKIEKKSSSVGASLKSGLAVATGAFAALAAGVGVSLKAYAQQEKEEQKIRATLAATGEAAEITAQSVFDLATKYQNLTTFGDDVILQGQAILLSFKGLATDALPRATEAMLDLATQLGTNTKSAALQLGKALDDPAEGMAALSRAGVKFSETERKLVKQLQEANQTAEAQNVIFEKIEGSFGGVARQVAQGTGVFTLLKNQLGEIPETIGKVLAPEFVQLAKIVVDLSIAIQANADTLERYKAQTIAVFAAVGVEIGALFEAVGKVSAGAALAVKGIFTLNASEIGTGISEAADAITSAVANIGQRAGTVYQEQLDAAINRRASFDAAQQQIAKVGVALDTARSIELDKLAEFKKRIKALEEQNESLSALTESPEVQRNLVAAELANQRLQLQVENDKRELKQQQFQNEQKRVLEEDFQRGLLDLRDEIFEANFESQLEDEEILKQQALEFELAKLQIRNDARRAELAEQAGYYFSGSRLNKEQQTKLLAETGAFGKALLKVESTLSSERLSIASDTFGNLQDLFNNFGLKNTAASKALQIAQVTIQGISSAFQTYATIAGEIGGIPGIIAGVVAGGIVAANAGFAVSKIASQKYNPKGLAVGSSGGTSGAAMAERFVSTFSKKEIVVPEKFSDGLRKGDLTLSGPGGDQSEMEEKPVMISVGFTQDAGKVLQVMNNENAALGVLPAV